MDVKKLNGGESARSQMGIIIEAPFLVLIKILISFLLDKRWVFSKTPICRVCLLPRLLKKNR
jgi:hypothetical protein